MNRFRGGTVVAAALVALSIAACAGGAPRVMEDSAHAPSSEPYSQMHACTVADFKLRVRGPRAIPGGLTFGLTLTNRGDGSCFTNGFAVAQPVNAHGTAIGAPAQQAHSDHFGTTTASALIMGPGTAVSFRVTLMQTPPAGRGGRCRPATGLAVYPPADVDKFLVPVDALACPYTVETALNPGRRPFHG